MEVITSTDNKTVKRICKLKQKKYRDEYGEFFVEGFKNVLDSCAARPDLVRFVALSETAYKSRGDSFTDYDITVFSDGVFEKLTETDSSQGVMSVHRIPKSQFPNGERCILLDRVRDPGNVGTILRTAVACGYDIVLNNCADMYSPKVIRSAMSAAVKCRAGIDIPPSELKAAGYKLIVADMRGQNVFESKRAGKYCIVVGNEASGVDGKIIAMADGLMALPQNNMESLNAAVAASVMMFAMRYAVK